MSDPWLAWQVRQAVFRFGSWFESMQRETKEEPMPETKRKPTRTVPKYSEAQLRRFLGIEGGGDGIDVLSHDPDLDRKAAEVQAAFQRGDVGWRELLGIEA